MNIAVCDDNISEAAEISGFLRQHLEKNSYTGTVQIYNSGEALLEAFAADAFDIVFLDIYMGGLNGIEIARKLRALDPDFALVFITISKEHALTAYSLRACAYVPKPIRQQPMDTAMLQCRSVFLKKARYIEIVSNRKSVRLPLAKILYAEVFGRELLFHTEEDIFKTIMPLDEAERILGKAFLRSHRSYLVNMNHIREMQEQEIIMRSGDIVPLRQRGRTEMRERYGDFLSDRLFEVD